MYTALLETNGWGVEEAWKAVCVLLLTCEIQVGNRWAPFHNVVVYRESNDFRLGPSGPNATIRKAQELTNFLAHHLGVDPAAVCATIGQYWKHPSVAGLQQHNPVGNAFRSIITTTLERFGDTSVRYTEEVRARDLFVGFDLKTRSENPKIDIVAFREDKPVALLSTRWRYRHDRVDMTDEAHAYATPATRIYGGAPYYAVIGEFSVARVGKLLAHAPPASNHGPIAAVVHFQPKMISDALGENGRAVGLRDMPWLCEQTYTWS